MQQCQQVDMSFFETAPKVFVNEVELNATPEQIFASFERAEDWPIWVDSIGKVEWTSPKPFGLGTTRTVTFTNGKKAEELFIAWEANSRMAFCFTATDQPGTQSFAEDYMVRDLGNGRSKLVWRVAFHPVGFSRIVFALFGFAVNNVFKKAMASFKTFIEAQPA